MMLNGKNSAKHTGETNKNEDAEFYEPASNEKLNWLIHLQHIRGETASCKELINMEIVRSEGKNEYAYFKQGTILKEEGSIQEALDTFQKCLKLNPQNPINLKEVATCLYDMRRYRLALNAYLEAEVLSKSPDWQLYLFLAQCFMKLGNIGQAKEYAHKSVKVAKQDESYALLVKLLMAEYDIKSAIAVANAAVESCPDSVNMLTESGLLYLKTGQTQHAFERLSQALALDPSCARSLLGIGCITQKHEEYDVALTKYKIAVLYEPESTALWNNIGTCFYSKQKYVAAISCLKRGLWVSPLNWKILYNLGLVHLATHQPASGFNFACAAVNLRPDVAECFALLGCTLLELKDTENALRAMNQACRLAPNDVNLICNAALFMEMTGAFNEANVLVEKYKTLMDSEDNVSMEVSKLIENLIEIQRLRQSSRLNSSSNENTETQNDVNIDKPIVSEHLEDYQISDDIEEKHMNDDEV